MTSGQHSFLCLNKQHSKSTVQEMFGMRVKERQITFDNCSVANMLQRLFPTWHASTLPPFFPGFESHLIILFNPTPLVIERYVCRLLATSLILLLQQKISPFRRVVNASNDKASSMRILVLNLYTSKSVREYCKFGNVFFLFCHFSLRAEILMIPQITQAL